ncbi:chemotaxis protein CheB [Pontibacter cellulosilyticus]|uniref:protein-glutamate O-methyltransferase n=1 Tax=Pontibacter cellulosilyticus TaxID=1720253 RepID=A0A923N4V1_9BACT|nr:chemotaxis protein CheB [Pontibacter cellulosilyticus]MBC5992253.1 PAS domain-containing protein [Pontibacter cellulosilyticus]
MTKAAKQAKNNKIEGGGKEVYVIGIGASAGGLQALESLFSTVPQDKVAYVIVQHISSEYRSLLTELLEQYSALKVTEAVQDTPVLPNRVYVIPNTKELTIKDNHLRLRDKTVANRTQTIDTFFTSLAEDKKQRAIGIVLSGTGTDGTVGIEAIKKAGGLVLVQDPTTAKFDGMPRSAINSGYADYILPPELMSAEIFDYIKTGPLRKDLTELSDSEAEAMFFNILDMVHERTGIDFSNYKRPTIIRRISRRMNVLNLDSFADYLDYLNQHKEELETLGKEFLIGVTKFFRDEEAYEMLASKVIPEIIDRKKIDEQLRVWVAGCSTGEEAYSIAILIREYLDKVKKELEVKIFASDIDREALDFAGKGLYPQSSVSEVSEERLGEYFVNEDGKYRITQRVRRMVIFSPHNVANDPPFSRIDLVSCRNMLIYLNPLLQKKVIDKFHYALTMHGYLFLGSSESIGELRNFEEVSKKWKIYRNTEPSRSLGMADTYSGHLSKRPASTPTPSFSRDLSAKQVLQHNFNELLSETMLEEAGYAAVYVDESYDVLHGAGKYKKFLELPDHSFTYNLLKLVPQDLAVSLGAMLRKAVIEKEKVTAYNVQVRDGEELRHINIVVKPYLSDKKLFQKFILILFSEDQPRIALEPSQVVVFSENQYENRVHELELELQYTKDDLQAVVEELETANEELQSTNEELLSSNEELQSTNEELQSLNEELHTINTEHQYKIKALVELDDDLNNYFRSTDIGQIFVDRKMIIRKYTPAATSLINLIESDIGRSINHISNNLRYDKLTEDVRHVIGSNKVIEKEVQDKNGVWYQMRILPYITQERKIDGAIIIFIQINELKNMQLLHAGILQSSPNAIMALKSLRNTSNQIIDFSINIINRKAETIFDRPGDKLINRTLWNEYPQLMEQGMFKRFINVVETGEPLDTELCQVFNQKPLWLHIVAVKFDDGLVLTMQDITERRLNEQALIEQKEESKQSAEKFRTLLEAVPHITWTNLPSGENDSFNSLWYEYTGMTLEESVGWGWQKAYHSDDLETKLPEYKRSLQTGEVFSTQARILRGADNSYRWHLLKNVPIRNEAGEILLWIGTATDIQDQKNAEDATIRLRLSQQREMLSSVLQAQEEERSRISEALHNGLGQVLYAAKLNLDGLNTSSAQQKKQKEQVDKFLQESIKITRDISYELTPTVLKEFGIKTAVEEIIHRLQSPKQKFTFNMSGSEEQLSYATSLSLYRIIQELLNNVVKHSGATKAEVDLAIGESNLVLRVRDNGKGMTDKDLSRIKGVGLRGIKNRIELLEGEIRIESSKDNGCLIEIKSKV